MVILPTLADRVWFALHSLPRQNGAPPSWRDLELAHGLPNATFSRTVSGERVDHRLKTRERMARALNVSEYWLYHGGDDTPLPTGPIPPRPGMAWTRHGDLPGWRECVLRARAAANRCPFAAYFAGADMVVVRPVDSATIELVIAAAAYAWETCTPRERQHYEAMDIDVADRSRQPRPATPAAKRRAVK